MTTYTECFYEVHYPLINVAAPNTYQAGAEVVTAYADHENYHRGVCITHIGTVAQGGDVHVSIYAASDALGTGVETLHTVNYTAAGIYAIEVTSESFTPGNKFVAVGYDVDDAAMNLAIIYYGIVSRYMPVPTTNWAGTHGP